MVTLTLSNRYITISGATRRVIRRLNAVTSYKVAGARFSKSFQNKWWDGRERLLTHSRKRGYRAPIGLLEDIEAELKAKRVRCRIVDERVIHSARRRLRWNPAVEPRDYQGEAKGALLNDLLGRPLFGLGTLKMPIRSGKTKTAAMIIRALGLRALFVVPSQMLLHQTAKSLRECFPGERIGVVGDGECDVQFITVATMQTLAAWRRRKKHKIYADICANTDVLIIDEAHHLAGESDWRKIVQDIDARFRIALSATAYMDNETEQERGIIWLKAAIGPIRIDIPEGRLIRAGHLMAQNVRMFTVKHPKKISGWRWSQMLVQEGITANAYRNELIANTAELFSSRKERTLIVANRLDHIAILSQLLWDKNVRHETMTGRDTKGAREEKVGDFVSGACYVLVGTVLAEGVDIPEMEVVINAEGGKDIKDTMQRMRNMTVSAGKRRAMLIDFMDDTNKYLRRHSRARWKVYTSIPEFNVTVLG